VASFVAMKVRVTKWRIAAAVMLLPVLYVLNVGPMIFCFVRFGVPDQPTLLWMYKPLVEVIDKTPFEGMYFRYIRWWEEFSDKGRHP
jgi:hypothetical protein